MIADPALDRVLAESPFGQTHDGDSALVPPQEQTRTTTAAASSAPPALEAKGRALRFAVTVRGSQAASSASFSSRAASSLCSRRTWM